MKTKYVPAMVMLLAGAVYCLIGIRDKVPFWDFTIQLLIILLVFYILGGILKIVLDKFIGELADEESSDEETSKEGDSEKKTSEEKNEEEEKETAKEPKKETAEEKKGEESSKEETAE